MRVCFWTLVKEKSEVRIGSSFNTYLDLEREFKLRADSEPDPGTSKKFYLNIFAYFKPIIDSKAYLGKF